MACLSATGLFSAEPSWETKSGPWGDLQVRAVYLEPPDNILAVVSKPSSVTRWTFEQTTEKGVRAIMAKAGLPATLIDRLMGPTQVVTNGNNLVVLPKVEDLLEIGEAPRSALYAELAWTATTSPPPPPTSTTATRSSSTAVTSMTGFRRPRSPSPSRN